MEPLLDLTKEYGLVGVGYRYKFVVQVFTAILLVLPGAWINSLGGAGISDSPL